jgi:pyridoxal phosphate enzyme (YggS family)
MTLIRDNIISLKQRIADAAKKAGRNPEDIHLIAVTKTLPVDIIQEAIDLGVTMLGENKVQEAKSKVDLVSGDVQWHLIGHLQKNKAKTAVNIFSMIQSVDSFKLGQEIDKRAAQINKVMDILVQINIGNEPQKYGVAVERVPELIKDLASLDNLRIKGVMAIAPMAKNPEDVRPYFKKMKQIYDGLTEQTIENVEMKYLSMGMSHDFIIAIEEGANMVRIGTGIFGPRIYK